MSTVIAKHDFSIHQPSRIARITAAFSAALGELRRLARVGYDATDRRLPRTIRHGGPIPVRLVFSVLPIRPTKATAASLAWYALGTFIR